MIWLFIISGCALIFVWAQVDNIRATEAHKEEREAEEQQARRYYELLDVDPLIARKPKR